MLNPIEKFKVAILGIGIGITYLAPLEQITAGLGNFEITCLENID